ncbi:MAG: PD-(D/E)XK motif protein [Deltaproteobacteria bacterium]|nr:PD-(D/E)XK motif protein [Deltaproteobacteria bacterium]
MLRCLFVVQFDVKSRDTRQRLPMLKGLDLMEHMIADTGRQQIIIALKDQPNSDLFYRLCCDLLDATRKCPDEAAVLAITINRLWRWQQLMKRGRSDKLSENEQKGLIGELIF